MKTRTLTVTLTVALTAAVAILVTLPVMGWAEQGAPMQPPVVDFDAADADSSGGISAEEWTTYMSARMTERRADALGSRADALIAAGDTDGDGALERAELIVAMTTLREQRRETHGQGRGGDRRMQGHDRDGGQHAMRGHNNDDGRGAMRGHGQGMARLFAVIDANSDGQIDAAELDTMQQRIEGRRAHRGHDNN